MTTKSSITPTALRQLTRSALEKKEKAETAEKEAEAKRYDLACEKKAKALLVHFPEKAHAAAASGFSVTSLDCGSEQNGGYRIADFVIKELREQGFRCQIVEVAGCGLNEEIITVEVRW